MTILALRLLAAGGIITATALISGALGFWLGRDRGRAAEKLDQLIREAREDEARKRDQAWWWAQNFDRRLRKRERGPFAGGRAS